jgi:sugar phosphate isomerase/epimerase
MSNLFSRRNFLRNAALAGTAVALPGCQNISAANPHRHEINKNSLKLGVMTWTLARDWDIDTLIRNLSEAGYQAAELRTTHSHGVEVTLNAAERAEVKRRFQDSPLESISLASGFSYHHPDQKTLREHIEGTKEYTLLARDVGAVGIRVFPNDLPDGVPEEKTLEQIGKAMAELGEFGYNHGVEIRIEVHGRKTNRVPVIKKIIDYSQSPHVYVVWNSLLTDLEGEGLEYNFNLVKDRIRHVHMHELWDERYPYRQFFRLLADNNYSGYCNAEIDGNPEPVRLMRYYRGLFRALQNAI